MNIFAMVTTRQSNAYTDYALASLIEHTKLESDDEVVLIDNDACYSTMPAACCDRVKTLVNEKPRSFAANVNQILDRASDRQASVIFLNNDLVFSPRWYEPLRAGGPFLLSPISNNEMPYEHAGFECKRFMDLDDYLGKEDLFREIVRRHRNRVQGYLKVLIFPFFAVKIPYSVYSVVGQLDESFGVGGGEDKDYSIRCYQHGFELYFALNSYLLHFQGKSTWRGTETQAQTSARNHVYMERFKQKWGDALFELFIVEELKHLSPPLREAYDRRDFRFLIDSLVRDKSVSFPQ